MKIRLRRVVSTLITVAVAASLWGCSGGGSTPANPGSSPAEPGTENSATTEGPSSAGDRDGSIVFSVDWPLYPDPGVGSKYSDTIALLNLYDTLTYPNNDGSVKPLVAESWDVSDDSTEYTFHLRDDVVFHSGNKLTANDVKFSIDRLMTTGEGYAYLFGDLVDSVTVQDDYTITFKLSKPSGTFPSILIRLYIVDEQLVRENIDPSGTYGEFGDYGKAWLLTNDAGSGPYKIKEMKTEEYLIIEKHESYWGGWDQNEPREIKLIGGIDGSTLRTMMSRGELDFSNDTQTPETYDALAAMDGIEVVRVQAGANFNLSLNTKAAPTDDVHVRRALAYAVDYDVMVNNIYVGSQRATGPVLAGLASALTAEDFPYTYDLEKAKAELEQSKYYDDIVSGRMPISLTWCTEGGEQQEKSALMVQANMAAIGAKVDLTGKPFATMMTDAQTVETTPNASFVAFAPSYLDAGSVLESRYHSNSVGTWEQMEWLQDPEIDAMIEEALKISDNEERYKIYREIQLKLVDICPTVWLGDLASTFAYNAAYVTTYPLAEHYKAGESVVYAMGYPAYFKNYRVGE